MANYYGDGANNVFLTTTGDDLVVGLAGHDWTVMYGGTDVVDGGEGSDTVSYVAATNAVYVDLRKTVAQNTGFDTVTLTSVENVIGSIYHDTLIGNNESNTFGAWHGNDRVYGLGGDDWIRCGLGNDYFNGGTGSDTASFQSTESVGIHVDLRITTNQNTNEGIDRFISIENVFGSQKNDVIIGNHLANTLSGDIGSDRINGDGGDDLIYGGSGNDRLNGDNGDDQLWGGAHRDVFVWQILNWGTDTIQDFVQGQDRIDIEALTSRSGLTFANLTIAAIDGYTHVALASEPDNQIKLAGVYALTASDFIF